MRTPGAILLISCYELGHQPLNLASPFALLSQAGYAPLAIDTAVESLADETITHARLVCISVPMHTALRLAMRVAGRVRALNPDARLCFYGLYAALNAEYLHQQGIDFVIGGEYEQALLGLVQALEEGNAALPPGIGTSTQHAAPILSRLPFAQPNRQALPPLERYSRLQQGDRLSIVGYVETSRGCLHTCLHCPITPVYQGRFFIIPRGIVLQDIRAQVQMGAEHITFGDPDFLNGPGHSLKILRAMHAEFPALTFDATIKIEHILEQRELFSEYKTLGCAFIVSAVEAVSDHVLAHLDKGHTRADVVEALHILDAANIPMRPSLLPFTPWTTLDDYLDLLHFVEEHHLIEQIDPVHYSIRLLLPPGSALLETPAPTAIKIATRGVPPGNPPGGVELAPGGGPQAGARRLPGRRPLAATSVADGWLGELDAAAFSYRWTHPDPRMDQLQHDVAALVETGERDHAAPEDTFYTIKSLAEEAWAGRTAGLPTGRGGEREPVLSGAPSAARAARPGQSARGVTPHLTESWFC